MTDLVFLCRSDRHMAALQLFNKLRGEYHYHCRELDEGCPFVTHPEQQIYAKSDLSRAVHGTTSIDTLFPTAEYTQLLVTHRMQLYRDYSGAMEGHEEHVEHVERSVLRLSTDSEFSLWRFHPLGSRDQDDLVLVGDMRMKVHSLDGAGELARQRATLILERDADMRSVDDDDWFPWQVLQVNLFMGPGVEIAIPGKKQGIEMSWIGKEGQGEWCNMWQFVALRVEELVPIDEGWEDRWVGEVSVHELRRQLEHPLPTMPTAPARERDRNVESNVENVHREKNASSCGESASVLPKSAQEADNGQVAAEDKMELAEEVSGQVAVEDEMQLTEEEKCERAIREFYVWSTQN
ncbi:hypothetical protein NA57DRAFT_73581 [Rhizodiscina lignyota]|uniref:Uncharacterized protein n=1 Tax=Rhizodiscina lignyota TaxID=1504668 RepID=A0A9P4MC73_9PEZI|nr:hypothetical protein NA57DRAFT_73581 [Rhizodiscina lignyota]